MNNETLTQTQIRPSTEGLGAPEQGVSVDGVGEMLLRNQKRFLVIMTCSVVLISFAVGITIGLTRGSVEAAYARQAIQPLPTFNFLLPVSSMQLTSMGEGARIGGVRAESASFTSNSSVKALLAEQVEIWKKHGLWTTGLATVGRGVAVAMSRQTKERYQTVAFFCPPAIREKVCSGASVFGVTSYLESSNQSTEEASKVPQCPQFKLAGIVSTTDLGKPSVTASGLCPAGLEQTKQYLVDTLVNNGWRERSDLPSSFGEAKSSVVLLDRAGEELSYVLSQSPNGLQTYSVGTFAVTGER